MKPRHWIAFVLVAAVLYPLAFGPFMAHRRAMAGGTLPTVPTFYKPLEQLSEASPTFRSVLLWYLQAWGFPAENPRRGVHRRYLHDLPK
jgi:hypothetical protein